MAMKRESITIKGVDVKIPFYVVGHTRQQYDVFRKTFQLSPQEALWLYDVHQLRGAYNRALILLPEYSFSKVIDLKEALQMWQYCDGTIIKLTNKEVEGKQY